MMTCPQLGPWSPAAACTVELYMLVLLALAVAAGTSADGTAPEQRSYTVKVCSVLSYGHGCVGDGVANCTAAFHRAITDCRSHTPDERPQLLVPAGTFLTGPFELSGSGWDSGSLRVEGTVLATPMGAGWPPFTSELRFIRISNATGFELTGNGTIDGQGAAWWAMARANPHTPSVSKARPPLVGVGSVQHLRVSQITLQNSPRFHLPLSSCSDVVIDGITIRAPRDAPNTDGIDVGGCTDVVIRNCHIVNGDDNVAVGSGSSGVLVEHNYMENGHGTSIGSLGFNFAVAHVSNVTVRHNVYNRTSNVARIKTWQGGRGECSDIHYSNLTLIDVENALLIDQFYCPGSQKHPDGQAHCKNYSSAVKVSGIRFSDIVGTHSDETAGKFSCSDTVPCEFQMSNVTLSRTGGKPDRWDCWNAHGSMTDVTPKPCKMP